MSGSCPVQIGCCGWSYDTWVGPFYSPGVKPRDYLEQYGQQFDVVEVDSTFYRTPSRSMVEGWHQRTPDHFRFSLKLPQVITHEKLLRDCQEELDGFLAVAQLLGGKLACICAQFGYFNREKFSGLDAFLRVLESFLQGWPDEIPLAVEIRNRSWLGSDFLGCLRKHRVALVLAVQSWMPEPAQVIQKFDVATGPLGYVRLLGDRKSIEKITNRWDKIVLDKTDEVARTAKAIQELARRVPVLAFANNHYAGYAPETAETLRKLIARPAGD